MPKTFFRFVSNIYTVKFDLWFQWNFLCQVWNDIAIVFSVFITRLQHTYNSVDFMLQCIFIINCYQHICVDRK